MPVDDRLVGEGGAFVIGGCDLCRMDSLGYHEMRCPNNPIKTQAQLEDAIQKEGLSDK